MEGEEYYPDPESLSLNPFDLSTASPPASHTEPSRRQKKKRKAWGQPIPDFKVVLPPRKRAKTAEEKEQRKNERVIRNRRAADKSRQRQKAAVAELETSKTLMEEENAALRQALAKYQATFGNLPGVQVPAPFMTPNAAPTSQSTATTPAALPTPTSMKHSPNPSVNVDTNPFAPSPVPTLSLDSPMASQPMEHSTSFTPSLFPAQEEHSANPEEVDQPLLSPANFSGVPDLTQYPAAILCDLQCQSGTLMDCSMQTEASLRFNLTLHIQLTIMTTLMANFKTFSSKMISPMIQIFQILGESLATSSLTPERMDWHFPRIQCLISTPTSKTSQGVFRTMLLSRLLACSPSMARLLEAATERALQRVVDDSFNPTDPQVAQQWASLLTIKWAIQCVEREHQRYRLMIGLTGDLSQGLPGLARELGSGEVRSIDYAAVEESSWRWRVEGLDSRLGVH